MRTTPRQISTLLLCMALAAPAWAQTTSLDGDWEGTWRGEGVDGAGASTSAAVATIDGSRIKLSRVGAATDVVLNGTIDPGGTVTLNGRGTGPDGEAILSLFSGTVSRRALTATGRAVPVGQGALQACALALVPVNATAGPIVLRGSAAPSEPPAPPPSIPAPPDNPQASARAQYDDDLYWRYQRLQRWEHWRRARDGHRHQPLPVCPPGQIVSPGTCRTGPPNAIGLTPPPQAPKPAAGATAPSPDVVRPAHTLPQTGRPLPAAPAGAIGPTPPSVGATQGARPVAAPAGNGASFGRPAAPAQGSASPRTGSFGPPACSRGTC
ncbi:hypothetical protein [Reyranella sp. CPCC 100927]|uniref:hypothetical protein n=1 Tax=Reyranella sp. CPCC 100927 TaxID=2599616 RepID=UPI0011B7794E|nr:hypothetical protein [Reyranella sp. CPCC 100927]TWT12649.1 hypothetical protein FQU96_10315 [Reyranella sp. CPCC 100927]